MERIRELENELGCFFDRNLDGTVHQKAFAGQTFDRTVHKGDLTGIAFPLDALAYATARYAVDHPSAPWRIVCAATLAVATPRSPSSLCAASSC